MHCAGDHVKTAFAIFQKEDVARDVPRFIEVMSSAFMITVEPQVDGAVKCYFTGVVEEVDAIIDILVNSRRGVMLQSAPTMEDT